MDRMQDRALEACMKHLESIGYRDASVYRGHIVARDDDVLVFVTVAVVDSYIDRLLENRRKREDLAFDYICRHPNAVGVEMRFDDMQLRVACGDRAMVRHQKNCLEAVSA